MLEPCRLLNPLKYTLVRLLLQANPPVLQHPPLHTHEYFHLTALLLLPLPPLPHINAQLRRPRTHKRLCNYARRLPVLTQLLVLLQKVNITPRRLWRFHLVLTLVPRLLQLPHSPHNFLQTISLLRKLTNLVLYLLTNFKLINLNICLRFTFRYFLLFWKFSF